MRECERKEPWCSCVDWKEGDLAVRINHFAHNFEFTNYELEYATLEPEEDRRLCKSGRCRTCGKHLCIGRELPSQATPDELLTEIYGRMRQTWDASHDGLVSGADCFTDMFLSVFHESDQEFVSEWLNDKARNISPSCEEGT